MDRYFAHKNTKNKSSKNVKSRVNSIVFLFLKKTSKTLFVFFNRKYSKGNRKTFIIARTNKNIISNNKNICGTG